MKEFPETGEWISIAPGEVLGQAIEVNEGDFLRLAVEQKGIDVELRLEHERGGTLFCHDSPTGRFSAEELLALAPSRGRYHWTVAPLAAEQTPGAVRVLEALSRQATQEDHALVAADQADRLGRGLLRQGRPREAIEALQQALLTFADRALARRQAETLLSLGEAQASQGAAGVAAGCCERAAALLRSTGGPHRLAHALETAGFLRLQLGEPEAARAMLEEARSLFEEVGESRREAAVLARLGSAFQALGQNERSVALLLDALERWRASGGGAEQEATILVDLGWALLAAGHTDAAAERFHEAAESARRDLREHLAAAALRGSAEAASRSGRHEQAREAIGEALDLLGSEGWPRQRMTALLTLGQVLRREGDLAGARPPLEEALGLALRDEDRRSEAILRLELGYLATQLGDPGHGLDQCERALALFSAIGDCQGQASAERRRGEARDALLVNSAAVYGRPFQPLDRRGSRPDLAEDRVEGVHDIEGAASPKRPVDLTGTDLPGEEDPLWEPDDTIHRARHPEPRLPRETAGDLAGAEACALGELDADGLEGASQSLLELDPGRLTDLLAASERTKSPAALDELRLCQEYESAAAKQIRTALGLRELPSDVDPHDLSQTGWGIVIARDEDPAVVRALAPLLERRRSQAGARFRTLDYRPGQSAREFLWGTLGESPGVLDPRKHPYYLLLVGGPERIPFAVQYQSSINHAVGRICFRDPAEYSRYVDRLLAAEDQGSRLPRRAAIFSAENGDPATELMAAHLVSPLTQRIAGYAGWKLSAWRRERARKEDLLRLLGGEETPGLLLISCHGKPLACGSSWQEDYQGALECQHTPEGGSLLHAGDLDPGTDLGGLVAFLFACYGAGTPLEDNFPFRTREGVVVQHPRPRPLAKRPFVARLPQALLRQGSLAVVGHVDRGWTLSFAWAAEGAQTPEAVHSLEDSLKQLLAGHRLGHALRPFYRRYTALAAQLLEPVEQRRYGRGGDRGKFAVQWIAHNDARNFIVLGDPAVYLLGQRLGGTRLHSDGGRALVELDSGLLPAAVRSAGARGLSLEKWVNEAVREHAQ